MWNPGIANKTRYALELNISSSECIKKPPQKGGFVTFRDYGLTCIRLHVGNITLNALWNKGHQLTQ